MSEANPIDALLTAEQQAEDDIQRARDAARETVNEALEQARAIRARAEKRITRLHADAARKVEAECQRLWDAHQADAASPLDRFTQPKTVDDIARTLARGLTTNGDDANRDSDDGDGDGDH